MDVLGHSTITLTANTDAHLTDATRRVAAGLMDEALYSFTKDVSGLPRHP